MKRNDTRVVRKIDERLIEELGSAFNSFQQARENTANWQDLKASFFNLTDVFYKAIEARAQAMNEVVKDEDIEIASICQCCCW